LTHDEEMKSSARPATLRELGVQYRGRVVRLKSGGPLMTVNQVVPSAFGPQLACSWFAEPNPMKLARAVFSFDAIEFVSDGQPQ